MGMFPAWKKKEVPVSEEERLRAEAEAAAQREAIRRLKNRALLIRENLREVTEEKVFDTLTHEQFVAYAHILGEEETVSAVAPAHYENEAFHFKGPVHALFLGERFVLAADEWNAPNRAFSFRYEDIGKISGKMGIFESRLSLPCKKGLVNGKKEFTPEGETLVLTFYLKSEYKSFTAALEKKLAEKDIG